MTFSGGAHCCTNMRLLTHNAAGWKSIDLGDWDGEGAAEAPRDLDKDGVIDFVQSDDRFLYVFASYAGSYSPSQIYNLIDGKFVDVSTSPRYRVIHSVDLERFRLKCIQHENSACAAMVASASRMGMADQYFAIAAANFDASTTEEYPTGCQVARTDGQCPDGSELRPANFLQSLDWFLFDNGYTTRLLQAVDEPVQEQTYDSTQNEM
jgi:hypothetical protein